MISILDLSRVPVNKGTNLRLWWTKYSDLYEKLNCLPEPWPHVYNM